jgi:hypothetical protein
MRVYSIGGFRNSKISRVKVRKDPNRRFSPSFTQSILFDLMANVPLKTWSMVICLLPPFLIHVGALKDLAEKIPIKAARARMIRSRAIKGFLGCFRDYVWPSDGR